MSHDLMTNCEQKKMIRSKTGFDPTWVVTPVSSLTNDDPRSIRCMHCHGAVQIHRQQVPNGPKDHVEHLSRQDSEHCQGGHYFKGTHQMSSDPVE